MDYIRDPAEIYRQSFAAIEAECSLGHLTKEVRPVAIRMVHACGITDLPNQLDASAAAVVTGQKALSDGATVLCDVEMVRSGIIRKYLPPKTSVICELNNKRVPELAKQIGNTRSAAAVDLWGERLRNAIVVIGNAPTALFRLLELLATGAPKPALIIGMPVGFVGAAESKTALSEIDHGCEFITLHGRMGGSALAAACFNAIAGGLSHA